MVIVFALTKLLFVICTDLHINTVQRWSHRSLSITYVQRTDGGCLLQDY